MKSKSNLINLFIRRNRSLAFSIFCSLVISFTANSQCGAGYSSATINWDNLEFTHNRSGYYGLNNPNTGLPFVTSSMWQTQRFAIGTSSMTFSSTIPTGGTGLLYGEITTHTGETGAYGTGADIAFVKTGTAASTITLTFSTEVTNLKFSVFDIDQEITFAPTATNEAGTAVSITLTKPAGASSGIPLNGSAANTTVSGTTPLANWTSGGGSGTSYATTSNLGTVNVDIAGPVKTVVLTFSADGNNNDFWISDITACVPDPGFPTNYYSTYTQPFTGQPAYFLANAQNKSVYMVNASTAVAEWIFTDPVADGTRLNSLAYDPDKKFLYYTIDGAASPAINRAVKKYDFNTGTISTVIADISTLGIPTFVQGVEAAGAAFYNGSLYLGIEEIDNSNLSTSAEAVIWKIDFDGSGNATTATQVFATPGDNGAGTITHDWGDLTIKDGNLITHATSGSSTNNQYIHYNMLTGASTTYSGNAEAAGQLAQIHNGNVYRIKNNIALYNNDGTIGSTTAISSSSCSGLAWSGNAGDGSDPFKPQSDFGDAPASYDPVALSPAVHDMACNNSTLRLGANWDREWVKNTSADALGDTGDEDGIGTVTVMNSDGVPYNHVQSVSVFNNTGANAYLGGWLDYNANGLFDASEGVIVTVPSSGSVQNVNLTWNSLTVASGTPNTFLRIRLSSTSLTTSSSTGWLADGEVEDYPVVSSCCPALGLSNVFLNKVSGSRNNVSLEWSCHDITNVKIFEIYKSRDQLNWESTGSMEPMVNQTLYSFKDKSTGAGSTWYRIKMIDSKNEFQFSNSRQVYFDDKSVEIKIFPNPTHDVAIVDIRSEKSAIAKMNIMSITGNLVESRSVQLKPGQNKIIIEMNSFKTGMYLVEIEHNGIISTQKVVRK